MKTPARFLAAAALAAVAFLPGAHAAGRSMAKSSPPKSKAVAKPAPAAPALSPSEQAESDARRLADERRFDEALTRVRAGLARDPGNADLLWLEAGILGWADHNSESVAAYERLLESHPELAAEVRVELAAQRLWANDPAGALRDAEGELAEQPDSADAQRVRALALAHLQRYGEALSAFEALHAQDPDDIDLAVDRATVLGWSGRNAEAAEAYEEILARHPDFWKARVGLAENENWQGNHRQAAGMFQKLLENGHDGPDVYKGLAYASYWDDDPRTARFAIHQWSASNPDDREATALARNLSFEEDQAVTAGFEASSDSDDMTIRTAVLNYQLPLSGKTTFVAMARDDRVEDAGGLEHPLRIGAGAEQRFNERWKAAAMVFWFDPRNAYDATGIGQANVAYRPGDRLRADFGIEIEPVLTRLSLANDIRVTNYSASLSGRAAERLSLTGGGTVRDFNDGNQALRGSLEARYGLRPWGRARFTALFGAELLRTDQDLNNGYYDPSSYGEVGPGAECVVEFANQVTLGAEVRVGLQREHGAASDTFYQLAGVGRIPLGRNFRLVLEVGDTNSSLSSESGFEQSRGSVYLTTTF